MEETERFLKEKIPQELYEVYYSSFIYYKEKFGLLQRVPISLQKSEDLFQSKLVHFLRILDLIGLTPEDQLFFWLGKLYFCLPLQEDWNTTVTFNKKKKLQYKNIICKVRPTIGYIYYLFVVIKQDLQVFKQMEKLIGNDKQNFYHFWKNPKKGKIEFFQIKSSFQSYLHLRKMQKRDELVDYGRLNLFYKKIEGVTLDEPIEDYQKPEECIEQNKILDKKFQIYDYQLKYTQLKFDSIISKQHEMVNREKIFKQQINQKNSNFVIQSSFAEKRKNVFQNFLKENQVENKFEQISQQKQLKKSQTQEVVKVSKALPSNPQVQKLQKRNTLNLFNQVKKTKPKKVLISNENFQKTNFFQEYQKNQVKFQQYQIQRQNKQFFQLNKFNPLENIDINVQQPKSEENRDKTRNLFCNIGQSKFMNNTLSTKNLVFPTMNIWQEIGEQNIRRVCSAFELPKPGSRLLTFQVPKKKKKKR